MSELLAYLDDYGDDDDYSDDDSSDFADSIPTADLDLAPDALRASLEWAREFSAHTKNGGKLSLADFAPFQAERREALSRSWQLAEAEVIIKLSFLFCFFLRKSKLCLFSICVFNFKKLICVYVTPY